MKKYSITLYNKKKLRYGENPHQKGWILAEKVTDPLKLTRFQQLHGKQLSFNNYLDIDAAVECITLIGQKLPACVVVKHTNPSGANTAANICDAFIKAWNGDSLAAFGSIIAFNRTVNERLAQLMLENKRFFEVVVCPSITTKAQKVFSIKKNLRILVNPALKKPRIKSRLDYKKIRGGLLIQEKNTHRLNMKQVTIVTKKKPTAQQLKDLLFAWNICQVSKANCIALVKNQQLVASGVGQQDRVRCCQLAVSKAGKRVNGAVAASDAFFPFPDGPEVLIKKGVRAIIHPGGSIRDQLTIDLCNKHSIAMLFTGIRSFSH